MNVLAIVLIFFGFIAFVLYVILKDRQMDDDIDNLFDRMDSAVEKYSIFEGVRDPAALVQAARDYDALCRELERWDGGNIMPEGHIEASIKVPEALSRLRAELGEGEG